MEWQFERIAGPYGGPIYGLAWDGQAIFFSVLSRSLILRYDPDTRAITEYRRYAYGIKGLAVDREGNLYGCQSSSRRIVRFNPDGSTSPMHYRVDEKFHNNPHDLAIDGGGRIWFSDPIDQPAAFGPQLQPPLEHQSVLRLQHESAGMWRINRMTHDTLSPRGVLLSRDERVLYVSDGKDGRWELRAYPVEDTGGLGSYTLLYSCETRDHDTDGSIDGMCLDDEGDIIVCAAPHQSGAGGLVSVLSSSGRVLETHALTAGRSIKCAFGDADLTSLYMTTSGGDLLRVRNTGRRGFSRNVSGVSTPFTPG